MKTLYLISLLTLGWTVSTHAFATPRTQEVKKADIIRKVTIAGKIIPKQTANIYAPYEGYIKHIYPKVGDKVKLNQPLLKLAESLGTTDEIFPLRSPINGIVAQINKQNGSYVNKGANDSARLMQIVNLDEYYIESKVPEVDINKIKLGMSSVVSVAAILSKKYNASIKEISLSPENSGDWSDRGKTQYAIRLKIEDIDKELRPGLSCIIDIIVDEKKDVLTLPHEFVELDGSKNFVELESGDRVEVEVGIQNDFLVEIKSGLKRSDKVKQIDFLKKATDI